MLGPILIFLVWLAALPPGAEAWSYRLRLHSLRCETEFGFTAISHVPRTTGTETLTTYQITTKTVAGPTVTKTPQAAERWTTRTVRTTATVYVGNPPPKTITQTRTAYSVFTPPLSTTTVARTSTVAPAFHAVADDLSFPLSKREPPPVLAPRHDAPEARAEAAFEHRRLYPTSVRCTSLARVHHTQTLTHRLPTQNVILKQVTHMRTAFQTEEVRLTRTRQPQSVFVTVTTTHVSLQKTSTVTSTRVATVTAWGSVAERVAQACTHNPRNYFGQNKNQDEDAAEGDGDAYIDAVDVAAAGRSVLGTADRSPAACCASCVRTARCAGSFFRLDEDACFHVLAETCSPVTGQLSRGAAMRANATTSCGCSPQAGIVVSNGFCGRWEVVYEP